MKGSLRKEHIGSIWKTIFEDEETIGIPRTQSEVLSWLNLMAQLRLIDDAGKNLLAEKLRSCDDAVKALPEYNEIWDKMC